MLKQRFLSTLVGIALMLALGFGLFRLFAIRWERGDVYPAYSSLRADPLGTRALFDSLNALPGFEVRRNFRPLQQLRPAAPITLVYASVPRGAQWGNDELRHFETLIANGSRAVFAFTAADLQPEIQAKLDEQKKTAETKEEESAQNEKPESEKTKKGDEKSGSEDEKAEEEKPKKRTAFISFSKVAERWGFSFNVATGKRAGSFHGVAQAEESNTDLESKLSWHSALRFTDLQPAWRVLYRAAGEPVVIERRWGDGTIVLAADSFFLSNEALLKERNPAFLAWLVGSPRTVIFDEEHHGVTEDAGLVSLVRKYNLSGAVAALAIVAVLWIWRQAVRFVPVRAAVRQDDGYVAGLDSHAGFVSLLRRTVPPAQALDACIEEWRKTFSHDKNAGAIIEQALAETTQPNARKPDPVAVYRAISRALNQKRLDNVKTPPTTLS